MDEEQPNHQKKDQDEVLHNLGKELSSYWCGAERNHGQEDHGEQNKDLYGLLWLCSHCTSGSQERAGSFLGFEVFVVEVRNTCTTSSFKRLSPSLKVREETFISHVQKIYNSYIPKLSVFFFSWHFTWETIAHTTSKLRNNVNLHHICHLTERLMNFVLHLIEKYL